MGLTVLRRAAYHQSLELLRTFVLDILNFGSPAWPTYCVFLLLLLEWEPTQDPTQIMQTKSAKAIR